MSRVILFVILILLILAYLFLPSLIVQSKYPLKYQEIIREESGVNRLNPALTASVIYNESRFNPEAVSDQEAIGLMQLQLPTAKGFTKESIDKEELREPEINIEIGCRYLRSLIKKYQQKELALIAYNLGPTKLDKRLKGGEKREDFGSAYHFAQKVEQDQAIYSALYSKELETRDKTRLSPCRLWKIIFLSRL